MRTHHGIGLMTEACNRLAANYAFLAVYSHIIIINVCECCVNYIKMLMQLTSITVINILTMFVSQFVYCIISDHTDGTAVQRATNNVDACTQCAYLFFINVNMSFDSLHLVVYKLVNKYWHIYVIQSFRKCGISKVDISVIVQQTCTNLFETAHIV